MKNSHSKGFTLLEMAVVLVIIGIITGGVMLGRSLLTTSRLQAVMTDADSYITAIGNFRQQYQALPGDMVTATTLWGAAGGAGGDGYTTSCSTVAGTSGTCNGNGDGMIANASGYEYESFRFWQHLNAAGMFNQRLNGVAGSAGVTAAALGTNVPTAAIGGGFSPYWKGTALGSDTNFFSTSGAAFYGNVLIFGSTANTFLTSSPVLTADQAAGIDNKIDDGVPSAGKVRSFLNSSTYAPNCATSATAYNLTSSGAVCSLIFLTGY